jgi:hypothetical protein
MEEERQQTMLVIYYDLEFYYQEITQIGAACVHNQFSQHILPESKIKKKKIENLTRVHDKFNYRKQRNMLFDMDTNQYLPTVLPERGLSIFFDWIWEMKQAGDHNAVCLVSYGAEDYKLLYDYVCFHHLEANISFLDGRFFDAQDFLPKYVKNCGLLSISNLLFPGERFRHHDLARFSCFKKNM